MSDQGPTVFNGRYELLRHIARGGMADVYLARDELLDREVALKVLFPEFANDPNFVERFRREAQAAANLNHPNIVGIYDWGQERGTYYIVMEHVSGRSMSDVLRSTGPLQPDRAAEIAADVAAALSTAHQAGLVHRDVKLGNILVSDGGDVKVADFGIATALAGGTDAGLTQHGSVMGTATYFSPEQAQGKPVDGRSDLYSLGVVLYEMLAGSPPFQAETPVAVAYKHVQERPEPLADRGVNIAKSLNAITMKLLAKNPANRYPTAEDLRSDLRRYLAGAHGVPDAAKAAGAAGVAAGGAAATATPEPAAAAPAAPAEEPRLAEMVDPTMVQPAAGPAPAAVPAGAVAAPAGMQAGQPVDPTALAAHYNNGGYYYDDEPEERDDWKRTALLLFGLGALIFVLGFLTIAFGNQLGLFGDDGEGDGAAADPEVVRVDVPNVRDMTVEEAERTLDDLNLVPVRTLQANATVDENVVFRQNPAAGTILEEGSEVEIIVSSGEATTVPSVLGDTESEARTALGDRGYMIEVVPQADIADVGLVIGQEPDAGTELDPGETVTITVSTGPDQVAVPDLKGKTLTEALQLLQEAGLRPEGEPIQESSATVGTGKVIRTEPSNTSLVDAGGSVTIYISSGVPLVSVPGVVGLFADTAAATLRNEGLEPVTEFTQVPFGDPQVGVVISQSPDAFAEVPGGTVITIVVGEAGPEPTTSTTTTTTTTTVAEDPPEE